MALSFYSLALAPGLYDSEVFSQSQLSPFAVTVDSPRQFVEESTFATSVNMYLFAFASWHAWARATLSPVDFNFGKFNFGEWSVFLRVNLFL